MSRVYFHSQSDGTAEVWGAERAMFGGRINDLLLQSLGLVEKFPDREEKHVIWYIVPDDHYSKRSRTGWGASETSNFVSSISTAISVDFADKSLLSYYDGQTLRPVSTFTLALNTALAMGSDIMKFAARIHGQCEIHAYVEGRNRKWLAGIIQHGLDIGFLRTTAHWDTAIELLLKRDTEPVVTSYSVCDSFPNQGVAKNAGLYTIPPYIDPKTGEEGELDWDAWYDVPNDKQWDLCLKALRKDKGTEMSPRRWSYDKFHFGSQPVTGYQVSAGALRKKEEDPLIIAKREEEKKRWGR